MSAGPAYEALAPSLRARLGSAPPQDLVEQVTDGLRIEPAPGLDTVTLIPQYFERPYNHHTSGQTTELVLYPADVLPAASERPPAGLLPLTRALSDESRLRILRFLADGPSSLTEVARFAGLSRPTVHHHLAQLRAAGLVRIHFTRSSPNRYTLRQHALEQLGQQLGVYLESSEQGVRKVQRTSWRIMYSVFDLEHRFAWKRDELLREAWMERLATQAHGRTPGVRSRLAAAL